VEPGGRVEVNVTFQEASARFQQLEAQLQAGAINEAQYRAGLNALRVTDPWGRLWMPQERTGQWFVQQNGAWVAAMPPQIGPPPPLAEVGVPRAVAPQSQPSQSSQGGGCGRAILYLIIWAVFWVVVEVVAYVAVGQKEPNVIYGVGLAAVLSLVLMLGSMASGWKGQIVEVRSERVTVNDGDGDSHHENRTYAYIRQANGKIRKEQIGWQKWQVGDWLEKRRGEMNVRKL
jgi:hypothetical protein